MDTSKELICVGAITGARGLKGEVKIKSFTADPKGISSYGDVFEENGRTSYRFGLQDRLRANYWPI